MNYLIVITFYRIKHTLNRTFIDSNHIIEISSENLIYKWSFIGNLKDSIRSCDLDRFGSNPGSLHLYIMIMQKYQHQYIFTMNL